TLGGFGLLLSFVTGPYIRGYNRISVYIAFFSIFALLLALDQVRQYLSRSRLGRLVSYGLPPVCLCFVILDQTSTYQVPPYKVVQEEYRSDAEFVNRIEASLPNHAKSVRKE